MKSKVVFMLVFWGITLPAVSIAKPLPSVLKNNVMRIIFKQEQRKDSFAIQFKNLRKQYPIYEKQIIAIEQEHNLLLQATKKSLTLAYHHVYYERHVIPMLENLYDLIESIGDSSLKKECINLLNHDYEYSTVRDTPSTYSYRTNLKHIAEVAVDEESKYNNQKYTPKWLKFYSQFDWNDTTK